MTSAPMYQWVVTPAARADGAAAPKQNAKTENIRQRKIDVRCRNILAPQISPWSGMSTEP